MAEHHTVEIHYVQRSTMTGYSDVLDAQNAVQNMIVDRVYEAMRDAGRPGELRATAVSITEHPPEGDDG